MNTTAKLILLVFLASQFSCTTVQEYRKTAQKVDINKFMGDWYVIAGRFTSFEEGAHNGVESYSYDKKNDRIDVKFTYNKDDFNGEKKVVEQTAWVIDKKTNAFWKISPFWPFKFDYLILDHGENYSWTAIGVPSQEYLWIMARDSQLAASKIETILSRLELNGYDVSQIVYVPHLKL